MKWTTTLLLAALLATGCATTSPGSGVKESEECMLPYEMSDPWEPFNRAVYRFNARFDEAIFLPVVRGYQMVLPSPARTGVNNFFHNLGELRNFLNHGLQGRLGRSLHTLGRFAVNTTLGIGGLFDPATPMGLEPQYTTFGDTLARWGTAPGPYLVLPLAGPSSLRDSGGALFDWGVAYNVNLGNLYQNDYSWAIGTLAAVDTRAHFDFRYYASGSPFEYEAVRFLYSNKRLLEAGITLPDFDDCSNSSDKIER